MLRWRYGSQLDWRLVTIGLSEDASRYEELGYTPTRMTLGNLHFRRHGMPFALAAAPARHGHGARLPGDRRDTPE